jgi:DNA-binding XRE family transcriptional regulator
MHKEIHAMAALIHTKVVRGKKVWYVWGAVGDDKWERAYPQCRSRSEFYEVLRQEIGLPASVGRTDIVFALMNKTWIGTAWVDDFTLRLKALRDKAGLTQAQLAQKAGLSPQAIAALEQGTRGPTWETVRRLAMALGVGEEEFKASLPQGAVAEDMICEKAK